MKKRGNPFIGSFLAVGAGVGVVVGLWLDRNIGLSIAVGAAAGLIVGVVWGGMG